MATKKTKTQLDEFVELVMHGTLDREGGYKAPKKEAQAADDWFQLRSLRLQMEKEVERVKSLEATAKEHLINAIPLSAATGVAGHVVQVSVVQKEKPVVDTDNEGWDRLWGYIVKEYPKNKGITALLQKRLGETAVKEMLESGKKIPGVTTMLYKDISYKSIKS